MQRLTEDEIKEAIARRIRQRQAAVEEFKNSHRRIEELTTQLNLAIEDSIKAVQTGDPIKALAALGVELPKIFTIQEELVKANADNLMVASRLATTLGTLGGLYQSLGYSETEVRQLVGDASSFGID